MINDPTSEIERRVKDLEAEVAFLKRRLDALEKPPNWISAVAGSMSGELEEAFLEAMKYGRELCNVDLPPDPDES